MTLDIEQLCREALDDDISSRTKGGTPYYDDVWSGVARTREPLLAAALLAEREEAERLKAEVESLTSNAKALRKLVVEPIEKTSKLQKAIAGAIGFESDELAPLVEAARLLRDERDALEAKLAAMTAARDEACDLAECIVGEPPARIAELRAVGKEQP